MSTTFPRIARDSLLPEDLSTFSVAELRAECHARGLAKDGTKPELVARLQREVEEAAAWAHECANPPVYEQGYRIVFDGGIEMPITLKPNPLAAPTGDRNSRFMFVHAVYRLPESLAPHNHGCEEQGGGSTVESAIDNVRRNVAANYPVAEFLRPGQKSRAELEAIIRGLEDQKAM